MRAAAAAELGLSKLGAQGVRLRERLRLVHRAECFVIPCGLRRRTLASALTPDLEITRHLKASGLGAIRRGGQGQHRGQHRGQQSGGECGSKRSEKVRPYQVRALRWHRDGIDINRKSRLEAFEFLA